MSERAVSRREVLKGSVALAISAGSMRIIGADFEHVPLACASLGTDARDTAADLLDTWIVVHQDGAVTVYFGKTDLAQGVDTAIAQVVAEELDVSVDAVSVVMGDTALTPNQGGLSASTACSAAAKPLRNAAAEARRLLIEAAAAHFGIASEGLSALDGVVFVTESKDRRVSYGQLIGGKGFAAKLEWNRREGNFLDVVGRAKPKDPASYRVVGQPVPRKDLPGKIFASTEFCHHVSIPGMLHGRMVRPPVANAIPQSVDEGSLDKGRSEQVGRVGNLLGVVAPTEWGAIKAAQRLRVTWSKTEAPFPSMSELHEHIRQAAPVTGNAANAFFGKTVPYDPLPTERIIEDSARVLNAEYELPFQSHARMAPSVAVADVSAECALIYSDTQKPHAMRAGLAKLLGLPVQQVRVVWRPGAGSYGRSDADEAAFEAA
ncbi:MAG TPA: molybdopterin cofactor-binding domain-containing protein, partial [Steroidobacteraceae bacterium]